MTCGILTYDTWIWLKVTSMASTASNNKSDNLQYKKGLRYGWLFSITLLHKQKGGPSTWDNLSCQKLAFFWNKAISIWIQRARIISTPKPLQIIWMISILLSTVQQGEDDDLCRYCIWKLPLSRLRNTHVSDRLSFFGLLLSLSFVFAEFEGT